MTTVPDPDENAADPNTPNPAKPLLRGWLHTAAIPLALIGGIWLILAAPTTGLKVACAVYLASGLMLFGTSAIYHRGQWSPDKIAVLRRMDHTNIFIFIAGTYTPLSAALLTGASRISLLVAIWTCAVLGVLFRVFWLGAPRWLYTTLYIAMGWAAVGWLPQFWSAGGPLVVGLVAAGGVVYSLGALVYARKRPNPSPKYFGFHEIFHTATVLAAICHFVAIALAI